MYLDLHIFLKRQSINSKFIEKLEAFKYVISSSIIIIQIRRPYRLFKITDFYYPCKEWKVKIYKILYYYQFLFHIESSYILRQREKITFFFQILWKRNYRIYFIPSGRIPEGIEFNFPWRSTWLCHASIRNLLCAHGQSNRTGSKLFKLHL